MLQLNRQVIDVFTDPPDGVDRFCLTSPNRHQITLRQQAACPRAPIRIRRACLQEDLLIQGNSPECCQCVLYRSPVYHNKGSCTCAAAKHAEICCTLPIEAHFWTSQGAGSNATANQSFHSRPSYNLHQYSIGHHSIQ